MKANEGMCHVLLSTNENMLVNIGTTEIQSSSEKLLEIKIDSKLQFKDRKGSTGKKASANINTLSRVSGYTNPDKRRLIVTEVKNIGNTLDMVITSFIKTLGNELIFCGVVFISNGIKCSLHHL